MKNIISLRFAQFGILTILSCIVIFHLLVIAGVIPFEIVWGGRLKDRSQMLSFESVSIILNLLMIAVGAINAGLLKTRISPKVIRAAIWVMAILFLLNTFGNIFSENSFEKTVFTPVTLLLSIFCLRIVTEKEKIETSDKG